MDLPAPAPTRSRRRRAAVGILAAAAISAAIGALAAALTVLSDPDEIPPEALLIPAMLTYVFAILWWAIAALLIAGLVLARGSPDRRRLWMLAAVAACALVVGVSVLALAGLFPWPW